MLKCHLSILSLPQTKCKGFKTAAAHTDHYQMAAGLDLTGFGTEISGPLKLTVFPNSVIIMTL